MNEKTPGDAAKPPRDPQVPRAMKDLDAATAELGKVTSELSEILAPVLAPGTPLRPGEKETAESPTPLVENVDGICRRVRRTAEVIENLVSRLEI